MTCSMFVFSKRVYIAFIVIESCTKEYEYMKQMYGKCRISTTLAVM